MKFIDLEKFPRKKPVLKRLWTVMDIPVLFEFACLTMGSAFIYQSNGLACIRALRPFRLLWYASLFSSSNNWEPR